MDYNVLLTTVKERLSLYLECEKAILQGAQYYRIGNRDLRRADLKEVRAEIELLGKQAADLESLVSGGGSRRIIGVIPRDI